jgi:hypothetical protein
VSRAEAEIDDEEPLRWYVVVAYVVLVSVGFALAVWLTVGWFTSCSDSGKTGTDSSYAGDSMRGTLCSSGHHAFGLLVPAGWVVGLVLATFALLRWGGGRLRAVVLALLFVTPAALPAAAYAGLGRSGTQCTGHELAEYRAWVDAGSKGTAPYDCRTF